MMAIVKNNFKVSRLNSEFSSLVGESISSDEDELLNPSNAIESDDDEFNDADSGAGSDDFDLLELGETMSEFCQIGNSTCSLPFELYDLPGLEDILSVDVWNEYLNEEDRFCLSKYLPDMDQETYMCTLKELFTGNDFHFGNPIKNLFDMLKGGLCEPRVALYREGLNFFQKRKHYHFLRNYHNNMVSKFCKIRDAWLTCKGYNTEEKLHVLNAISRKSLVYEKSKYLETDSSGKEQSGDVLLFKKDKNKRGGKKLGNHPSYEVSNLEHPFRGKPLDFEAARYRRQDGKGIIKMTEDQVDTDDVRQDRNFANGNLIENSKASKAVKKRYPFSSTDDFNAFDRNKNTNRFSEMKVFSGKKSHISGSYDISRKAIYRDKIHQLSVGNQTRNLKGLNVQHLEPLWHNKSQGELFPVDSSFKMDDRKGKSNKGKMKQNFVQNGEQELRGNKMFSAKETDSYSSDQFDDNDDDNDFANPMMKSSYNTVVGSLASMSKSEVKSAKTISNMKGRFSEIGDKLGIYSSEVKKTAMAHGQSFDARVLDDSSPSSLDKSIYRVGNKQMYKLGTSSQLPGDSANDDYDPLETKLLINDRKHIRQRKNEHSVSGDAKSEPLLLVCNSMTKKRKVKGEMGDMEADLFRQFDNSTSVKRKGKRKLEVENDGAGIETCELPVIEMGLAEAETESKPLKKPYTPITPTVHSGFSYSIIHLLSAVRMAMTTPLPEDSEEVTKLGEEQNKNDEGGSNGVNMPTLTVHEIETRVRSNPLDPCILEIQEPLNDLVRGVLKIFSSKAAPLGAKGWKPLVVYEKSKKCWSWIGPVCLTDREAIEEVTSAETWGLPHKMLVKLVDVFANWFKSSQETLQQIGSLPEPPLSLMQANMDEESRFKEVRSQKSLITINPSSEEVRNYFRKEEFLRYSIPDRTFSYTTADGKKSIVAPLRRCNGKPTSKARDHFMLKRDRPPHVTILCLVRDAAARLPRSIGTRADVCTLIRDSQYIVDEVTDSQVNQVVSGALDRLHYERDPCVQYDSERKLWVYLHRDREEEDFEDDGTSSTKKWKRQKKDPSDQVDQTTTTTAHHGLGSDLNIEPSIDDDKEGFVYNDETQNLEENFEGDLNPSQQPAILEGINLNEAREVLCQENSTNEDFGDETFERGTAEFFQL